MAQTKLRSAHRSQTLQLLLSAQDDEFGEFEAIRTEFAPKFIECGLDGRCLGDGVTTATGWHD